MRGLLVFIWEQWRQTNKALAIVFGGLVLFALIAWKSSSLLYYIFSNSRGLVVSSAHLPALGAVVLLLLQENRGRVGFSYPRRMLVLPAHTFVLVAAPLIYRLAIIAFFGYATGWVCDTFLKEVYFKGPEILLLMTLAASIHALVFLVCGYGAATGTAIFLAAFLLGLPGLNVFLRYTISNFLIPSPVPSTFVMPGIGYGGIPTALIVLPYWFFAAYLGARRARSETAEDPIGGLVRLATRITYFDRERTEFSSPEAAQQWFEWRRGAYLFPWFSFALGLALVLVLPNAAGAIEQRFIISFFVLGVAPAVVASLVGYVVTRPGSDYQWFVGARPLDTATIARARLRAGLKAVLWAYVLLGMLFVVSFKIMFWGDPIIPSVVADFHTITSTHGPFGEGLMAVALLSAFAVLTSWSLFWLARMAGVAVMLSGAAIASWLYLKGGGLYAFDADTGTVTSPITPGILLMAGIAAALGVCAIVAAMRRGYIRVPVLAGSLIAWLLLIFLGLRLEAVIPFGGPLVIGAWMLLPFIPLASIPLTLEWQRHR